MTTAIVVARCDAAPTYAETGVIERHTAGDMFGTSGNAQRMFRAKRWQASGKRTGGVPENRARRHLDFSQRRHAAMKAARFSDSHRRFGEWWASEFATHFDPSIQAQNIFLSKFKYLTIIKSADPSWHAIC